LRGRIEVRVEPLEDLARRGVDARRPGRGLILLSEGDLVDETVRKPPAGGPLIAEGRVGDRQEQEMTGIDHLLFSAVEAGSREPASYRVVGREDGRGRGVYLADPLRPGLDQISVVQADEDPGAEHGYAVDDPVDVRPRDTSLVQESRAPL